MRNNPRGFTLVELMIVVAIIGILAAIAIPNFLKFNTKTKQSEARYNLAAIYSAQTSYFGEFDSFSSSFNQIRWRPEGSIYYYTFTAGTEYFGLPIGGNPMPGTMLPGASTTSFTACAWGNIDNDPTIDQWLTNDRKDMLNPIEDWRM